ncbi:MAG: ATP-dependent helicase [Treponema sp.]|nr:ATP-dependent helicase [Treponema sp.]
MQIDITDKDIDIAEKFLLSHNQKFDEERRRFIKDLSTLDLQAVPGSGKTTALLAKLLILSKKLPFENNTGILVISHTNAAIDEIKNKLGNLVPSLFEYPNFVGTIQSFVDTFLAIPFYTSIYNYPPQRIDNEVIYERCNSLLEQNNPIIKSLKQKQNRNAANFLFSLELDENGEFTQEIDNFGKQTKTYKLLSKFKKMIFRDGFLKFSEAYDLAFQYIQTVPSIVDLLKKRFYFVFVDEMQDMDDLQSEILEQCFFSPKPDNCFQRIGDINQAIYSDEKSEFWVTHDKVLNLNGSQRLSPEIASVVQHFSLQFQQIEGRMKNPDGSPIGIKPYLLIYEDSNITKVIPYYFKLIMDLKEKGLLRDINNEKYSIIGWRKSQTTKPSYYNINSYWPAFIQDDVKTKNDYDYLFNYLIKFDRCSYSLESIRKSILNAILKIMRIEKIRDINGKYYSKRSLFDYLKTNNQSEYEDFKLRLLKWCKNCIQENYEQTLSDIQQYIQQFLSLFDSSINYSKEFIYTKPEINLPKTSSEINNVIPCKDIMVDIQTIHSIKGQTVTGVLYLDTFNALNCTHAPSKFESGKLGKYFLGDFISKDVNVDNYIKQASKMIYVGFSRATHLLCYAVQKDRFNKYLSNIDNNIWNIEYIK